MQWQRPVSFLFICLLSVKHTYRAMVRRYINPLPLPLFVLLIVGSPVIS